MKQEIGFTADGVLDPWTPEPASIAETNAGWLMRRAGVSDFDALHDWSVKNREAYWAAAIERLDIRWRRRWSCLLDLSKGLESPRWLTDAQLNIVESCLAASPGAPAIVHQREGRPLRTMNIGELAALSRKVAAGLRSRGFKVGDRIAMVMPMTPEAVAIYLGIIQIGGVVVAVPESFRGREIDMRLRLAKAAVVFTQDVVLRDHKQLELYRFFARIAAPMAVVLPAGDDLALPLRRGDVAWKDFLTDKTEAPMQTCAPHDPISILFSSGTTGEPKAIPWPHMTPIKCAADAHFHLDVRPGDVLVWPTNLGWMMGPWLVFAALLNRAAIGIFDGTPTRREFGDFVEGARATMLGVVPSLVKTWRGSGCMEGLDWSAIRVFSSTGEQSNPDDVRWLMHQGGWKPVIEYCGGTEIGGAYITGTITKPCYPGVFNTPALGLDFVIFNEQGQSAERGELFLAPPSIGLSTELLNKDHHQVYFEEIPKGPQGEILRRHGDVVEKLPNGGWRVLGRADDTMNLGGIKVSSAEIEQTLQRVPGVKEVAAIAVCSIDGPSQLVVYASCLTGHEKCKDALQTVMQETIRRDLNPLFKISDVVLVDSLPRTASNKVSRRALRDGWLRQSQSV
jgi:acetyl-CoA synthetase